MIYCTIYGGVLPSDGTVIWYIVQYTVVFYHQMVLQDDTVITLYDAGWRITVTDGTARWYIVQRMVTYYR